MIKDLLKNKIQWLKNKWLKLYVQVDQSMIFPFYRNMIRFFDRRCEEKIRAYGLISDWKERSLQEFKLWLADMPQDSPYKEGTDSPTCDLYTLLAEFAGLRSEIMIQNREQAKAVKALSGFVDSCSETFELLRRSSSDLRQLEENIARSAEKKCLVPFFDVRDTLIRSKDALAKKKKAKGFFSGGKAEIDMGLESFDMTLRRFDRALSLAGIMPVETHGKSFDPKTMKAVSVITDNKKPDSQVVEQIKGGFIRDGQVLVTADVVVTKTSKK